jgi:hypothetical protein
MTQKLTVADTLRGSFTDLGQHLGPLLFGALVVTAGVGLATTAIAGGVGVLLEGGLVGGEIFASIAMALVGFGVWAFFYTGFVAMVLDLRRGQRPSVGSLFLQAKRVMPAWVAVVAINGVLFLLPLALGYGALGIVPGLSLVVALVWVPLGWAWYALTSLTIFYLVDYEQPGLTAVASSIQATRGQLLPLMGLLFLAGLIGSLLSLVPLVGSLCSFCFQVLVVSRAYFALRTPRG